MTCYQEIACPDCGSHQVVKTGYSAKGERRYRCCHPDCPTKSFMRTYRYKAYQPGIKTQVVDMAINRSGIRDTARVLGIAKGTVISTLKKSGWTHESADGLEVRLEAVCEAELDEQWSFVGKKSNPRWLWYAVDHATNTVIAHVFGKRKDAVFKQLKTLLGPFGIARYYTDDWDA